MQVAVNVLCCRGGKLIVVDYRAVFILICFGVSQFVNSIVVIVEEYGVGIECYAVKPWVDVGNLQYGFVVNGVKVLVVGRLWYGNDI